MNAPTSGTNALRYTIPAQASDAAERELRAIFNGTSLCVGPDGPERAT